MAINKSSDLWENAEAEQSMRKEVLEYLEENNDQAYRLEELADELLATDNLEREERWERMDEIGKERFYEEEDDSDPGDGFRGIFDDIQTTYLRSHLSALNYDGDVELRLIPNDDLDNRFDEGVTGFHTIVEG